MSNSVTNAFFFGRALAEVLGEKLENSFTNTMSELGKFDAEQRENLRKFIEEVELRAENIAANAPTTTTTTVARPTSNYSNSDLYSGDLQAMLDQLRAEIASVRAELKQYREL